MSHSSAPERATGAVITEWRPEDPAFWQQRGHRVASRNLWISVPCLLLAFCVWMLFSAVAVNLPKVGFNFTTDQLFYVDCAAVCFRRAATCALFLYGSAIWRTSLDSVQYWYPHRALRMVRLCRSGYQYAI